MTESDMKAALDQMRSTQWAADRNAGVAAELIVGRLRHVTSNNTLAKLKRELRAFNIHTCTWSEE